MTDSQAGDASGEVLSPGLVADDRLGRAFELKFQIGLDQADAIEAWARAHLRPDVHGQEGQYAVATVYCDTPAFDVFHRTAGYQRSKFRLRRYGDGPNVFLERKSKKGDRIRKERVEVPAEQLAWLAGDEGPEDWVGGWFRSRLQRRGLRPTCMVGYDRTAFVGGPADSPVRLTLDRQLIGAQVEGWDVPRPVPVDVEPILPGEALLELKFHVTLPPLFRDLLADLPVTAGRASKYRRCVLACRLAELAPPIDPPIVLIPTPAEVSEVLSPPPEAG